ncbi:hypothetical protein [Pseudoalteromonas sp. ASV78]
MANEKVFKHDGTTFGAHYAAKSGLEKTALVMVQVAMMALLA